MARVKENYGKLEVLIGNELGRAASHWCAVTHECSAMKSCRVCPVVRRWGGPPPANDNDLLRLLMTSLTQSLGISSFFILFFLPLPPLLPFLIIFSTQYVWIF